MTPNDAQDGPITQILDRLTTRFGGRVGYVFTNLSTGARLALNEDEEFPTASTVKLPVLSALHEHARASGWDFDRRVPVSEQPVAAGSGILQYLSRDLVISYRDLAWLMICVSDNTATNLLINSVGRERLADILREKIDPAIRLRGPAGAAFHDPNPSMGYATPAALGRYLGRLAEHALAGSEETLEVAGQQVYHSMIPRYLPRSADADVPVTVAHKTGALPGIRTDIGVVSTPTTTVTCAVMTADAADQGYDTIHEGELYIGAATYAVCRAWLGLSSETGNRALDPG